MKTLIIRHVAKSEPAQFQVVRLPDGKSSDPRSVASPFGFLVEGRPESDLICELNWYLETFLEYPFEPEIGHAERVLDSLRAWGQQAFEALFGDREGGRFFEEATRKGHQQLDLLISSDEPRVLSWPWEALRDPETGVLAQTCQIERRLNHVRDPQSISAEFPADRINILLVTARPYESDVHYRSISRPMVELIQKENLPAHVHVLRPPTIGRLRQHLQEHPQFYHLVHFDGHGSVGGGAVGARSGFTLHGQQGHLIFEDESGQPQAISAEQISVLLREHSIPCMVLNACQSAVLPADAEDPFAAVAAALVQAGIRSVVAMAWSLYVSGAQQFLQAFYRRLFESGNVAEATRAGRQQMFANPDRVCARGRFPLQDWLVPVVYQQDPFDFSFAAQARVETRESNLPEEVQYQNNPHGFVGRDGPVLKLERAMRQRPAGILIQGLGGIGKTTLARGFVQWLAATDGLDKGCFWFGFGDIRNAEYVFNRIGEALLGSRFPAATVDERIEALTRALREYAFLIVWDNFEVVQGIPGTPVEATMPEPDRQLLLSFLQKLRGGRSKVLITSRSEEEWLGVECLKISLGGLEGEERWEYCERIFGDLGISIDREDENLVNLMNLLDGHPLVMRVILPKLEKRTATDVVAALTSNLQALNIRGGDEAQAKLYATLQFAGQSLPESLQPLLTPLALHEGFVDADYVEIMTRYVDGDWTRVMIDAFLEPLAAAGLLRDRGQAIYEMHPALTGFLRATWLPSVSSELRDSWARAFVDVMGRLAEYLAIKPSTTVDFPTLPVPRQRHEQRGGFHFHSANFYHAMGEAQRLRMDSRIRTLLQALGAYAQNVRNYRGASELFTRLAEAWNLAGDEKGRAAAYHQLGRIAEDQRDFNAAEQWYRQSLAISEKHGDENVAGRTYNQLGTVAYEQRDFDAAEQWHRKSLAISEKHGDEHLAASTYNQLGRIAQEQRDFNAAKQWYCKSLAISEKHDDEDSAAMTYHNLGMTAQQQRDFDAAERWYRKSLAISEKHSDEHLAAITYHQLGITAEEQRDFNAAEQWYRKSLEIKEKQGDEHGAASTYHQLGRIVQEQRNFNAAEQWYRKSLAISEKHSDEHLAASTYGQLGLLASLQEHYEEAGQWLLRSIFGFKTSRDPHGAQQGLNNFFILHERADTDARAKLKKMWEEAGLGVFPNDQ
jgi:tetratricopeptide (TPR) repeat protein